MRAIVYSEYGGPDVLRLTDRPAGTPGPGEVLVRVARSGVNPTDWKSVAGGPAGAPVKLGPSVPGQDGAGTITAVGDGVDPARVGERVWVWEAAYQRTEGTLQEQTVVAAHQAVTLPSTTGLSEARLFDLGAALGIPFLTAHRTLTVLEDGPVHLHSGALQDRVVLVAGGAGAVGNAAIQLARWADATVLTTVSSPAKAQLARAAGADHVIDYRTEDVARIVRGISPRGVDIVVEVAPAANAALDTAVIAHHGVVACYADDGGPEITLPVRKLMGPNARWQIVLVYTEPAAAKGRAVADISRAVADGAIGVGESAGLPLHHFALDRAADAQRAVAAATVGKVLVDLD
jgi:NADPH2:quinone reductase